MRATLLRQRAYINFQFNVIADVQNVYGSAYQLAAGRYAGGAMSDKKICLTHNHADEQLEIAALAGADLEPSALQGDDFCADADAVREAALLLYGKTREWLNVLVGDQNGRKKSKGVACHCFGDKMLSGSVLHYEDNTYIASADFDLLLQARDVHFVQL